MSLTIEQRVIRSQLAAASGPIRAHVRNLEAEIERLREALAVLRKTADIYQATVRPVRYTTTEDGTRIFERKRALQRDLLDAIGEAYAVLQESVSTHEPHTGGPNVAQ